MGQVVSSFNGTPKRCESCRKCFHSFRTKNRCRQCAKSVCASCSESRLANLQGPEDGTLYRICNGCADELLRANLAKKIPVKKSNSSIWTSDQVKAILIYLAEATANPEPAKAVKEELPLEECPACTLPLKNFMPEHASKHITSCLNMASRKVVGNAYSIEIASKGLVGKECQICLDAFQETQRVALLNCFCMYHFDCIEPWFSKGKACPSHFQ